MVLPLRVGKIGEARAKALALLLLVALFGALLPADSKIEKAKVEISRGNTGEARRLLVDLLKENPRQAEANYWLGYIAVKAGDYGEAIGYLEAAAADKEKPEAARLLAKAYILAGRNSDAEQRLLALTRATPGDAEAWSLLGQLYQTLNRFSEAVKPLETALELNQNDLSALNALAFTRFALGENEAAEKDFKKAVRLNSVLARPQANAPASYAIFLLRMNRVTEAKAQIEDALLIDPRNPTLLQAQRAFELRRQSGTTAGEKPAIMGAVPDFEEIGEASGIAVRLENSPTPAKHQVETMPGGVAVLDYDEDGLLDLYFTNGAESPSLKKSDSKYWNRLYRNLGDWKFADVTEQAGVQGVGYMMGAAAGDYNKDGYTDLFVVGVDRNILYLNRGDGTFSDETHAAGLDRQHPDYPRLWGIHAGWLDFDNDGWLDLLVVNYCAWDPETEPFCGDRRPGHRSYCYPGKYAPLPNQLFRNNGDSTFTDVSLSSGLGKHLGKGMGAAVADFNSDGLVDIFVANDTEPNFLFVNSGGGVFVEDAAEKGVALNQFGAAMSSMGADFRDVDNDGRPDLFVTALANEGFLLFRNNGRFFDDVGDASGITVPSLPYGGWSNAIVDLNNDGWKDLFSANSHALDNIELFQDRTYRQRNSLFLNKGDGTFQDVSDLVRSFGEKAAHRGSAFGDLDNDGRMDLVVTALGDAPRLFRNTTAPAGHWLMLELRGREANRDGIGAVIMIQTEDGRRQWNHASTCVGFASSSDPRVHFGLGGNRKVRVLEITWPGGKRQTLENVSADQILVVQER